MRNYIVDAVGLYDSETFWVSEDQTPEDVMFDAFARFDGLRVSLTIMEVDTLDVDDEEGYTPGDVFDDYLRDGADGDTASGITRLAMWEMGYHLDKV